jgi:hypothetical protein
VLDGPLDPALAHQRQGYRVVRPEERARLAEHVGHSQHLLALRQHVQVTAAQEPEVGLLEL